MSEFESLIKRLLSLISERVEYLKEISARYPSLNAYKKAKHVYKAAAERDLQVAIEACLDIGKIIISEKALGSPGSMREICETLFEKGIISERMLNSLLKMVGMRNIIVHRYEKIDDEVVYSVIKNHLGDFELFIKEISKNIFFRKSR